MNCENKQINNYCKSVFNTISYILQAKYTSGFLNGIFLVWLKFLLVFQDVRQIHLHKLTDSLKLITNMLQGLSLRKQLKHEAGLF